ncbi:MAG: DUF1353 domain-containing protein [Cellvibrionaceae bacterium]
MKIKLTWNRPKRFWQRPVFTLDEPIEIAKHSVPVGFKTDGASLPWLLRSVFSPMGPWFPAAALHDYLLTKDSYTRKMAAKAFYQAMGELGIWQCIRKPFYLGVRGWDRVVEVFK